ncbi:aminoglycoside phosphotransferase family protein [Rickettsiales endosymbiont of Stachyamoeba lipophora]|uniref:aminoglycoside phosphotransferase family protein n=1 Tax=Rickettsiales endosymbiont of Stachyamoeba lipophora TaxID=2486578 RepID=UPI000F64B67E|nr:hypothetical protein EF513_06235 [Rickettsiales endosymbiont of Stachyamoeba lipophora]
MLSNPRSQFLHHGDLHHHNILKGKKGKYLAIDLKGELESWNMKWELLFATLSRS